MQNILTLKKEFILLITGLLLVVLAMNGNFIHNLVSTRNSQAIEVKPTPAPDPSKDLSALGDITYVLPAGWQKVDHVDPSGLNTYIKITSPDFNSPQPGLIDSGIGIVIGRVYDLNAEESVKAKLNASYDFDTYNVIPLKINNKNAVSMHKDGINIDGRFIFVATNSHLWDITITSKNSEDAQRYQGDIDTFLDSINF